MKTKNKEKTDDPRCHVVGWDELIPEEKKKLGCKKTGWSNNKA